MRRPDRPAHLHWVLPRGHLRGVRRDDARQQHLKHRSPRRVAHKVRLVDNQAHEPRAGEHVLECTHTRTHHARAHLSIFRRARRPRTHSRRQRVRALRSTDSNTSRRVNRGAATAPTEARDGEFLLAPRRAWRHATTRAGPVQGPARAPCPRQSPASRSAPPSGTRTASLLSRVRRAPRRRGRAAAGRHGAAVEFAHSAHSRPRARRARAMRTSPTIVFPDDVDAHTTTFSRAPAAVSTSRRHATCHSNRCEIPSLRRFPAPPPPPPQARVRHRSARLAARTPTTRGVRPHEPISALMGPSRASAAGAAATGMLPPHPAAAAATIVVSPSAGGPGPDDAATGSEASCAAVTLPGATRAKPARSWKRSSAAATAAAAAAAAAVAVNAACSLSNSSIAASSSASSSSRGSLGAGAAARSATSPRLDISNRPHRDYTETKA